MLPAFRPGRIVIATGYFKAIRAGDVVVVSHGGLEKVKRVKQINGEHIFVVGDNEQHSTDSRSFGWLHSSVISGKVVWPRTKVVYNR